MTRDDITKFIIVGLMVFVAGAIVHSVGYRCGYEDGFRHAGEMSK